MRLLLVMVLAGAWLAVFPGESDVAAAQVQASAAEYEDAPSATPVADTVDLRERPGATEPGRSNAIPSAYGYDFRPDCARPPPSDVASIGHDPARNLADPVPDPDRVRRVSSGVVLDRVAPRTAPGLADDVIGLSDRAAGLQTRAGRNRVSIETPSGRMSVDLQGGSHYERTLGRSVETPQLKFETRHVGPNGRVSYTSGPVRPATFDDLRLVDRILRERGL